MKKLTVLVFLLFFSGSVLAQHTQETGVPLESIEEGETFEARSDELGTIEAVELEVRHDDESPPWDSAIEVMGQDFDVIDEERVNEDEAVIIAETDSPVEIFESDVELYAEANEELLAENIVLKGSQRFQGVEYAEEEGTGIAETFDPELSLSVDHPDGEEMEYTFYDIDDDSELGETYTFTTCGEDGRLGPSQSDCDDEYEDTSLEGQVEVIGSGVQEWEVPFTGRYELTAVGAVGGGPHGGSGAVIKAEVTLEQGDRMRIVSGQEGDLFEDTFTAGSGGSFVTRVVDDGYQMFDGEEIEPVLVAGGGAGSTMENQNQDAQLVECGDDAQQSGSGEAGSGGCDGEGGSADLSDTSHRVGGGAGLLEDGQNPRSPELAGTAFIDGAEGGDDESEGGFGGGGAARMVSWDRGGGGGGYSGGGSARGDDWAAGGGGGSYVSDESRYDAEITVQEVSSSGQGYVEFDLESSPSGVIGYDSVNSGETASVEWSDRENFETYNWAVEVCEEGASNCVMNSESWTFTVEVEEPEVELSFENYTTEHAFDVTADIEFGRDDYNPRCDFNFTNLEDPDNEDLIYEKDDIEVEEGSGREASCQAKVYHEEHEDYDSSDGIFEGYEVLDRIRIGVNVTDQHGELDSNYTMGDNIIPNIKPFIESPWPQDGMMMDESPVELSVDVHDQMDDEINVFFFNDSDDTLIGKDEVTSGDTARASWRDLRMGAIYNWYVKASDTYENRTSNTFQFRIILTHAFRPEIEVEYPYTTVVASQDQPVNLIFRVENSINREKNLNISLQNVNAEYIGEDNWYIEDTLEPESERRYQILVEPEDTGLNDLEIVAENQDMGVETVEKVPIYGVDIDTQAVSRGVPGIGLSQVLLIVVLSTAIYIRSIWT